MSRESTGSIKWMRNVKTGKPQWHARFSKGPRLGRTKYIAIAANIPEHDREGALADARRWAAKARVAPAAGGAETFEQYAGRWIDDREGRVHSVRDDRSRMTHHVAPVLGPLDARTFTRDDVERLRDKLDARIAAGALSWKTAANVWTLVTSMFYPGNIVSLLFSGASLFLFGRILEPHFGHGRFFVLYAVSGFGAAVSAFLLDGSALSAYGAVIGMAATLIIMARKLGSNPLFLYISVGLSAVLAVLLGGWQSFLGGFIAGGAVGFIYLMEDNDNRRRRGTILLIGVGVALVLIAFARALFFYLT